jgi:uncharacterized cupin superfamily protein
MAGEPLDRRPVHLGLGATAEIEPRFTGAIEWYEAYAARHEADGSEARLVAQHSFSGPWEMWEMHPHGAEVVIVTLGEMTLHQDDGTDVTSVHLAAGDYAINDPGIWHTADVEDSATAIFITAGLGTQHRPR